MRASFLRKNAIDSHLSPLDKIAAQLKRSSLGAKAPHRAQRRTFSKERARVVMLVFFRTS
jgi:hypothetical protein